MCEALWQPDMSPEEIFECIAQALTNALDRDASSGKYKNIQIFKKNSIYLSIFISNIFFNFRLGRCSSHHRGRQNYNQKN